MNSQRNIGFVLIGDTTAYTSASSVADIAAGEIAAVDAFGNVITTGTAAAGQKFRLVQGRGAGLTARSTDLIDPSGTNVKSLLARAQESAVQQVTSIGFNGSTGTIDTANDTRFLVRFNLIETDKTGFAQQPVEYGTTYTDIDATQWEIARDVVTNINDNMQKIYERPLRAVSMIDTSAASEATSLTSAAGNTVNVVQDSDLITEGASVAWNNTPAVGEVIVLDAVANVGYEVIEVIDSTTVRVHVPYQGDSLTDVEAVSYTAASIDDSVAAGVQVTGQARNKTFNPNKSGWWSVVRFETQLDGWGDTTVTSDASPTEGFGNYEQVAREEYLGESVFGNRYRSDFLYSATVDTDTSGATYYGCITMRWESPIYVSGVGPQPSAYKTAKLWVGDDQADGSWDPTGNQAADLISILNTICGTSASF